MPKFNTVNIKDVDARRPEDWKPNYRFHWKLKEEHPWRIKDAMVIYRSPKHRIIGVTKCQWHPQGGAPYFVYNAELEKWLVLGCELPIRCEELPT